MESVLHSIEELQRLAADLATSAPSAARDKYEADCELFLGRITTYVTDNNLENADYISGKLEEVRTNLTHLLRLNPDLSDPSRYESLAVSALNLVYRTIRNPVTSEAAPDYE